MAVHGDYDQNSSYMNFNYRQRQLNDMNFDYGEMIQNGVTYYLEDEDYIQAIKYEEMYEKHYQQKPEEQKEHYLEEETTHNENKATDNENYNEDKKDNQTENKEQGPEIMYNENYANCEKNYENYVENYMANYTLKETYVQKEEDVTYGANYMENVKEHYGEKANYGKYGMERETKEKRPKKNYEENEHYVQHATGYDKRIRRRRLKRK